MQRGGAKKKNRKKNLALAQVQGIQRRCTKKKKKNLALAEVQGMQREGTKKEKKEPRTCRGPRYAANRHPVRPLPHAPTGTKKILKSQSPKTFTI
jgi:hypothetical protein